MPEITEYGATQSTAKTIKNIRWYVDHCMASDFPTPRRIVVKRGEYNALVREAGTDELTYRGLPVVGGGE